MYAIERVLVWLSLQVASLEQINAFFGSAQNTAIVLGALIALSGGMLGSFLLLRGMALTSDAISHTVLLGIVVAFMIMGAVGAVPDISSPWLLIGAAAAGVSTVVLTELLNSSGLLKQDAALGLVFPLLFALAVIFISRYVEDVHIDEDAVMVGEIGIAWANTNSHAFGDYETMVIDESDPRAEISRRCVNCREEGISPRDPGAIFEELCTNCGEYSPAEAYRAGFSDEPPVLVFWPRSITVMLVLFLLTLGFVLLFFKELKLSTFDPGLARSLGFRPTLLLYVLMSLVSLVAVGAFEAVGSHTGHRVFYHSGGNGLPGHRPSGSDDSSQWHHRKPFLGLGLSVGPGTFPGIKPGSPGSRRMGYFHIRIHCGDDDHDIPCHAYGLSALRPDLRHPPAIPSQAGVQRSGYPGTYLPPQRPGGPAIRTGGRQPAGSCPMGTAGA
jgi:ABC-type Mn2+/Zn2+ transport system permease subunit